MENVQKQDSLPQNLFLKLREDILSGKIPAGQKLSEQAICDSYMVSRTPVREAFQKLELEGLIEIFPNRGAFVLDVTRQDLDDTYELMRSLESLAVKWAIDRMSEEDMQELQETYELMEFYVLKSDAEKLAKANVRFHSIIYRAAGNRMLMQVLTSCQARITHNQFGKNKASSDFMEEELGEHEAILMAIKAGDKETAVAAATRHVRTEKKRSVL